MTGRGTQDQAWRRWGRLAGRSDAFRRIIQERSKALALQAEKKLCKAPEWGVGAGA